MILFINQNRNLEYTNATNGGCFEYDAYRH